MIIKKNIKVFLLLFIIIGLLAINYINAYLLDSDTTTNPFTVGSVKVELTESKWSSLNGQDLYPNETVEKNPVVKNVGKNECYVGMSLSGLKEIAEKGFIIGDLKENSEGLINEDEQVFCWNPNFTLVNRDGSEIEYGNDSALTVSEINSIITDGQEGLLYFAYNHKLSCDASTEPLFTGVQYKGDSNQTAVKVIKYFTKEDGSSLYYPVESGYSSDGEPSKDEDGNYIYKYKISVNGIEENTVYDTYESAREIADSYKVNLNEEFNLSIKAAAIQALNDSIEEWESSENWYPQLPSDF